MKTLKQWADPEKNWLFRCYLHITFFGNGASVNRKYSKWVEAKEKTSFELSYRISIMLCLLLPLSKVVRCDRHEEARNAGREKSLLFLEQQDRRKGRAMSEFQRQHRKTTGYGKLFIVGGAEERVGAMPVLGRFLELCGGPGCSIAVLTSASTIPVEMWEIYDAAFKELGARRCFHIYADSRAQADDEDLASQVLSADGIFMTGGDQRKLVETLNGSRIHKAMWTALNDRGACIGGTSAGASAIAQHMLAHGSQERLPHRYTAQLEPGLGFLHNVTIDQHFFKRQRLARLLSAVAQNPELIGVGIEEDTALVVSDRSQIEIVGAGAVTLLDGRAMRSNIAQAGSQEHLELINVTLHLLPGGSRYDTAQALSVTGEDVAKNKLLDALRLIGQG